MILSVLFVLVSTVAQGFSPEDVSRIQLKAQDWTFQFKAIQGEYPSRNALENAARECITGPSDVCVLVDPVHRWTSVHFGTATGVPKEKFNIIAATGNPYFRNKDMTGGVLAIGESTMTEIRNVQRQAESIPQAQAITLSASPPVHADNSGWLWFGGIFLLLCLFVGYFMYRAFKNQKKLDEEMKSYKEEKLEFMNANVNRMLSEDSKPKQEEAPRTKVVFQESVSREPIKPIKGRARRTSKKNQIDTHHHYHHNDSLIVTAPIIQPMPVVVEAPKARDPDPEPVRRTSSWSSNDSSSSSYDSGGGGSDWSDSGGGFDSGGGGSDW